LRTHPAVANARIVIEQEELERRLRDPERHAMRRFWKALMLATDVEASKRFSPARVFPSTLSTPNG
jgi:hypothetical protein